MIATDTPEFQALAQLADLDSERMGAGFNDPANIFQHLTLEELQRIAEACARFASVQTQMSTALSTFQAFAKGYLAGRATEER